MKNLTFSKHYKSTEVDRRTWLDVPSESYGPPAGTLAKYNVVEIQNVSVFT